MSSSMPLANVRAPFFLVLQLLPILSNIVLFSRRRRIAAVGTFVRLCDDQAADRHAWTTHFASASPSAASASMR
jgi:hypothetical protein